MNPVMKPEILEALKYQPAVSIIMPFEPKMSLKMELTHSLKIAADKVQRELSESYPYETGMLVMQKLRAIIKNLNFSTHKKSIAIYVSPVFEKVLYLDIGVEEKIVVAESFEICNLVNSKKQLHKYLVLLLSGKESGMYLGDSNTFVRIISNTTDSVYAYVNEMPERLVNFSDFSERREMIINKFLLDIDDGLDIIVNAYRLPLFVLGPERILEHFKKLTKHAGTVIEYVKGNYEKVTEQELKEILKPYIEDWRKVRQKELLNQLEEADGKKKLSVGMRDVWHEAMMHKGRLLLIEKKHMYTAQHGSAEEEIYQAVKSNNKFSYIKDAVDAVIEKVLENGGDVEFTDKDVLKDYHHIALVQFY